MNVFDNEHFWTGDSIEPESPQFQAGKYKALQLLLPFTQLHTDEAACVVLKRDGRLLQFQTGAQDEVDIEAPAHEGVALLHTHSSNHAHSESDWVTFLCFASLVQSHVIAPDVSFSLHKPAGWKIAAFDLEEHRLSDIEGESEALIERNKNKILEAFTEAAIQGYEREGGWSAGAEARVREAVAKQMATRFGILSRIGRRKPTWPIQLR